MIIKTKKTQQVETGGNIEQVGLLHGISWYIQFGSSMNMYELHMLKKLQFNSVEQLALPGWTCLSSLVPYSDDSVVAPRLGMVAPSVESDSKCPLVTRSASHLGQALDGSKM